LDQSESHSGAVERFQAAREERDRRAGQYNAASGSPQELPAFTELQAAEDQLGRAGGVAQVDRARLLVLIARHAPMKSQRQREDERRAEKLRQVARRIKHGSSMVGRMTSVKRAVHVRRQHPVSGHERS
jgi:hypothetical protein